MGPRTARCTIATRVSTRTAERCSTAGSTACSALTGWDSGQLDGDPDGRAHQADRLGGVSVRDLRVTKRAILVQFHQPFASGEDPTVDLIVALNRANATGSGSRTLSWTTGTPPTRRSTRSCSPAAPRRFGEPGPGRSDSRRRRTSGPGSRPCVPSTWRPSAGCSSKLACRGRCACCAVAQGRRRSPEPPDAGSGPGSRRSRSPTAMVRSSGWSTRPTSWRARC